MGEITKTEKFLMGSIEYWRTEIPNLRSAEARNSAVRVLKMYRRTLATYRVILGVKTLPSGGSQ